MLGFLKEKPPKLTKLLRLGYDIRIEAVFRIPLK